VEQVLSETLIVDTGCERPGMTLPDRLRHRLKNDRLLDPHTRRELLRRRAQDHAPRSSIRLAFRILYRSSSQADKERYGPGARLICSLYVDDIALGGRRAPCVLADVASPPGDMGSEPY